MTDLRHYRVAGSNAVVLDSINYALTVVNSFRDFSVHSGARVEIDYGEGMKM